MAPGGAIFARSRKGRALLCGFLAPLRSGKPGGPAPNRESVSGSGEGTGSAVRTVLGKTPEMEPVVEPSGPV